MEDIDFDWKIWVKVFVAGCAVLTCIALWVWVFGPMFNTLEYNNFNSSPQHIQAVAQKFADDCQQIALTQDPTAIKALDQDIFSLSTTVNMHEVNMTDGVRACVNQAITNVTTSK